jgi:Leucine-rich repeat (LRR) protein
MNKVMMSDRDDDKQDSVARKSNTDTIPQIIDLRRHSNLNLNGLLNQNLHSLLLSHCSLTSFPPIYECFGLRVVHLSNNQIDSIPISIARLQHLRFLTLDSNKLSSFPNITLDRLKHLQLSNNQFQSQWPLPEFNHLESLSIRNNQIKTMFHSTYDSYPSLKQLDISNNHIKNVPVDIIKIEFLSCSCNQISTLPLDEWTTIASSSFTEIRLVSLLIGGNPVEFNENILDKLLIFKTEWDNKRKAIITGTTELDTTRMSELRKFVCDIA